MPFDWLKKDESGDWTGFLEQGARVEGKLELPATFRLDCVMKGSLHSAGTLILGEHASFEGQIDGNHVVIAGRFDGTIQAKSKVELQARAVVTGEISTPCLIMDPGALFDGQCHMLTAVQSAQPITVPIRSATVSA